MSSTVLAIVQNALVVYQSATQNSQTDLDIYFPPFKTGSCCSYYTEALSLAFPLFCNHIPPSPLSTPMSRARHLLTGQLEGLTHHRLGSAQLGCEWVCVCTCAFADFPWGYSWTAVTWISLSVCPYISTAWAARLDHPNRAVRQDTQVVPTMNSTALSVSRAKMELHMHKDLHCQGLR